MAQFDIHPNPSKAGRSHFPLVIILQSDVSIGRNSVVIAPIARRIMADADDRAVIPIDVEGQPHVVMLHGLTAVPRHTLGKPVARAPELAERLPRAIDYLFLGI